MRFIGTTSKNKFNPGFNSVAPDIFNVLHEIVIVTDGLFYMQNANSYALKILNYDLPEITEQPLKKLFDDQIFGSLLENIKAQLSKSDVAICTDTAITTKQSVKIPINISVATLNQSPLQYVFVCTQIDELQKLYGSFKSQNAELEALNKRFHEQEIAMLNLLEDSHDLSVQLQQEKADVEKKVDERTMQLHAEHARLEASINSLDAGFIILDREINPFIRKLSL
ncbi:MAG TPA: PAS domain-containing protein [Candidatus Saccharimonadales bacterium]|nr:PAS domain-containing protein [Candidatus Saccharimonadales bacterium]